MKSRNKYLSFLLMVLAGSVMLQRCSKDETGKPSISYVRVTNPASSDSLVASGGQGQMIAIIGENLQSTREVWFNDQQALLPSTFVTNTSIIVRIPSTLPAVINNEMKLVFGNGESLLYDFTVNIAKPSIDHVRCEYVNTGDSLIVYGDYFYTPLVVSFANGVKVTSTDTDSLSTSADYKTLYVKMPSGVQPGPITITSTFGARTSNFWMQDNRNIIVSFDLPFTNNAYVWKGKETGYLISSDPQIASINGKFCRVNKGNLGAWPFLEIYGGVGVDGVGDVSAETKNIPEEAFLDPTSFSLKFEINTQAPVDGGYLRVYIGNEGDPPGSFDNARQTIYYVWQAPAYESSSLNGVWKTVTIPWADVYSANQHFPYSSNGYGIFLYWHGPNAATYNYAMDNIRVVPNK